MAEVDPGPLGNLRQVPEQSVADGASLDVLLRGAREPFVVRGLVADWPLVAAGRESSKAAREYLLMHHRDRPFTVSVGAPGAGDRLFYDDQMGMNFKTGRSSLPDIFAGMESNEDRRDAPAIYLSSIDLDEYFEGLEKANRVELSGREPLASIWIGTRTRIAAHNDFPDNLACCAVGSQRFTLFPPDQFENLYLGPIDNTPAGRAVSMVDLRAPDFEAHPRFQEALANAQVAELNPGDAIFIPSMWWHHVEGLAPFNVLVNYWWRETPRFLGQPQDALNHAILAIRDLPGEDRKVWRALFDYYVFTNGPDVVGHIPEKGRGILAPLDRESAGRLRAFLLRALSQ